MIDTYVPDGFYTLMNYNDNFVKFTSLLSHKKIKETFEFSPLFVDMFEYSQYSNGGFWSGDIWYYDDPQIQEYFVSFCDGYTQGLVDYFVSVDNEKEEARRRMEIQMKETDDKADIVIDFSQYLK